jgi:hypothetical protein
MSKQDTCETEAGAKELVVLRRQKALQPSQSFPNTAESHPALIRCPRRAGRVVRVCLESTGCTDWTWLWRSVGKRGLS